MEELDELSILASDVSEIMPFFSERSEPEAVLAMATLAYLFAGKAVDRHAADLGKTVSAGDRKKTIDELLAIARAYGASYAEQLTNPDAPDFTNPNWRATIAAKERGQQRRRTIAQAWTAAQHARYRILTQARRAKQT